MVFIFHYFKEKSLLFLHTKEVHMGIRIVTISVKETNNYFTVSPTVMTNAFH